LREAADGTEALAMIAASQPDVVVLDLRMPGLDGFGVLDRLLERPETSRLPVVVLTGRELSESERRFLNARSSALLEKREYSGTKLRRLVHHAPSTIAVRPIAAQRPAAVEDNLTAELVAASGEERRRIAREIHDDSIQAITALGMRSQILQRSLTDPAQLTILADLEQTMQLSIARLRQVADDLAPPALGQDRLATTPAADAIADDNA
jgi:CheY-like chemotaxis protein